MRKPFDFTGTQFHIELVRGTVGLLELLPNYYICLFNLYFY